MKVCSHNKTANKKYFRLRPQRILCAVIATTVLLTHCFLPHRLPIEFGPTRNSAIQSADPQKPTLEPNTEWNQWIGCSVAEISHRHLKLHFFYTIGLHVHYMNTAVECRGSVIRNNRETVIIMNYETIYIYFITSPCMSWCQCSNRKQVISAFSWILEWENFNRMVGPWGNQCPPK